MSAPHETGASVHALTVDFPGHRALDNVDVEFRFDEVHGLVGENGAGKSTLVNVLGGSLSPTRGQLRVGGRAVTLGSPRQALVEGIAHVSQEGSLVPQLDGAANLLLGAEPVRFGAVLRRAELATRAAALLADRFPGVSIDLGLPVEALPMADRKVLEIVRALRGDIRLLILDEPTATLPSREKARLWEIIRSLPSSGVGVVLVSHFLSEIRALSDRVTVLRDGLRVGTFRTAEASEERLVDLMLRRGEEAHGSKADQRHRDAAHKSLVPGPVVLSVRDWQIPEAQVSSFELRRGEIVGLVGLTGAGHFDFARSLYTREALRSGRIEIDGSAVTVTGIRAMQRAGVAFVPDRRMENALSAEGSLTENLAMVHPEFAARGPGGVLSRSVEHEEVSRVIDLLQVRASGHAQSVGSLSGGNKQKVSIGKWLYGAGDRYHAIILIEPTEGVDIGAKQEIYARLRRLAGQGVGVLIVSSDLLEIAQVTDRVVPFVRGLPGRDIARADYSEARFIAAIAGDNP